LSDSGSPAVDAFALFVEAPAVRHLPRVEAPDSSPGGAAAALPALAAASGGMSAGGAGPAAPAAATDTGVEPMLFVSPAANPHNAIAGYSPAQIRHAYGFDQLSQTGAGQTIAIVDAFDAPKIASDLDTFSGQFGLPKTTDGVFTFTKAYAQGSKPAVNTGWAQEISLDVEWAHAIAPRANILLVETASNSYANLLAGVDYAVSHGAHVVSMSWGGANRPPTSATIPTSTCPA
jgi:subtilase family serine protease